LFVAVRIEPRGENDVKAPQYESQHVDDFLNVPEDRLDDCLDEFRTFLNLHIAQRAVVKGLTKVLMPDVKASTTAKFVWIDDGKKNVGVVFQEPELR
jgi:hypothetical protein